MVKAQSEQYVYFDNTIGRNATVTVSVGEEVSVGQQLVQYDSTSAQAAYDTASRAYNRKAVRDRNYFQQYGTAPAASAQTSSDSDEDDSTTTVSPQQRQQTEASNYQTLQRL